MKSAKVLAYHTMNFICAMNRTEQKKGECKLNQVIKCEGVYKVLQNQSEKKHQGAHCIDAVQIRQNKDDIGN